MAYLVATTQHAEQGWRRPLPLDVDVVVGRTAEGWELSWDPHVSRQQCSLRFDGEKLEVRAVPEARNPIFFRGRATGRFTMRSGESFVVGGTTVTLDDPQVAIVTAWNDEAAADERQAFDSHALRRRPFLRHEQRLELLARLTESLSTAVSDDDWATQLVSLVLAGVARADVAALIAPRTDASDAATDSAAPLETRLAVRHWDRRGPQAAMKPLAPPAALLREALAQRTAIVQRHASISPSSPDGIAAQDWSWSLCVPVSGDASRDWLLYVVGDLDETPRSPDVDSNTKALPPTWADGLLDDVKFVELLATTAGQMRDTQRWVGRQSALRRFFSPRVLEAIRDQDVDSALAPRETDVTVLFCDLRGFSRASEASAHDLRSLLDRVSEALGVMTQAILAEAGVIGDFHGDSAMGFWGWPFAQPDAAERACRAALAIQQTFSRSAAVAGHRLAGFRAGVGIASGRAVAGRIGTIDQVKVTVFGPVVNRASRLESFTKRLGLPILIDDVTAAAAHRKVPRDGYVARRVGRVVPEGMDKAIDIWQLVSCHERGTLPATRDWCAASDRAVESLVAGDWDALRRTLDEMPRDDSLAQWLHKQWTRRDSRRKQDWNGAVPFGEV